MGLAYDAIGKEQEAEDSYKKAIELYKKYLEENRKTPRSLQHGAGLCRPPSYSEAVREYRQATRIKDDDADMFYDPNGFDQAGAV